MKRNIVLICSGILLASCATAPTPDSYTQIGLQVEKRCAGEDLGQDWVKSLFSDQEKLQASLACASYYIGRRDMLQEVVDQLNNNQPLVDNSSDSDGG